MYQQFGNKGGELSAEELAKNKTDQTCALVAYITNNNVKIGKHRI